MRRNMTVLAAVMGLVLLAACGEEPGPLGPAGSADPTASSAGADGTPSSATADTAPSATGTRQSPVSSVAGETPVTASQGGPAGSGRSRRGAVEGVVRTTTGPGLPRILIVPVSLDEPAASVPEVAVLTDGAGRYRWDLAPGRYELRALREGTLVGSTRVEVAPGRTESGDITVP